MPPKTNANDKKSTIHAEADTSMGSSFVWILLPAVFVLIAVGFTLMVAEYSNNASPPKVKRNEKISISRSSSERNAEETKQSSSESPVQDSSTSTVTEGKLPSNELRSTGSVATSSSQLEFLTAPDVFSLEGNTTARMRQVADFAIRVPISSPTDIELYPLAIRSHSNSKGQVPPAPAAIGGFPIVTVQKVIRREPTVLINDVPMLSVGQRAEILDIVSRPKTKKLARSSNKVRISVLTVSAQHRFVPFSDIITNAKQLKLADIIHFDQLHHTSTTATDDFARFMGAVDVFENGTWWFDIDRKGIPSTPLDVSFLLQPEEGGRPPPKKKDWEPEAPPNSDHRKRQLRDKFIPRFDQLGQAQDVDHVLERDFVFEDWFEGEGPSSSSTRPRLAQISPAPSFESYFSSAAVNLSLVPSLLRESLKYPCMVDILEMDLILRERRKLAARIRYLFFRGSSSSGSSSKSAATPTATATKSVVVPSSITADQSNMFFVGGGAGRSNRNAIRRDLLNRQKKLVFQRWERSGSMQLLDAMKQNSTLRTVPGQATQSAIKGDPSPSTASSFGSMFSNMLSSVANSLTSSSANKKADETAKSNEDELASTVFTTNAMLNSLKERITISQGVIDTCLVADDEEEEKESEAIVLVEEAEEGPELEAPHDSTDNLAISDEEPSQETNLPSSTLSTAKHSNATTAAAPGRYLVSVNCLRFMLQQEEATNENNTVLWELLNTLGANGSAIIDEADGEVVVTTTTTTKKGPNGKDITTTTTTSETVSRKEQGLLSPPTTTYPVIHQRSNSHPTIISEVVPSYILHWTVAKPRRQYILGEMGAHGMGTHRLEGEKQQLLNSESDEAIAMLDKEDTLSSPSDLRDAESLAAFGGFVESYDGGQITADVSRCFFSQLRPEFLKTIGMIDPYEHLIRKARLEEGDRNGIKDIADIVFGNTATKEEMQRLVDTSSVYSTSEDSVDVEATNPFFAGGPQMQSPRRGSDHRTRDREPEDFRKHRLNVQSPEGVASAGLLLNKSVHFALSENVLDKGPSRLAEISLTMKNVVGWYDYVRRSLWMDEQEARYEALEKERAAQYKKKTASENTIGNVTDDQLLDVSTKSGARNFAELVVALAKENDTAPTALSSRKRSHYAIFVEDDAVFRVGFAKRFRSLANHLQSIPDVPLGSPYPPEDPDVVGRVWTSEEDKAAISEAKKAQAEEIVGDGGAHDEDEAPSAPFSQHRVISNENAGPSAPGHSSLPDHRHHHPHRRPPHNPRDPPPPHRNYPPRRVEYSPRWDIMAISSYRENMALHEKMPLERRTMVPHVYSHGLTMGTAAYAITVRGALEMLKALPTAMPVDEHLQIASLYADPKEVPVRIFTVNPQLVFEGRGASDDTPCLSMIVGVRPSCHTRQFHSAFDDEGPEEHEFKLKVKNSAHTQQPNTATTPSSSTSSSAAPLSGSSSVFVTPHPISARHFNITTDESWDVDRSAYVMLSHDRKMLGKGGDEEVPDEVRTEEDEVADWWWWLDGGTRPLRWARAARNQQELNGTTAIIDGVNNESRSESFHDSNIFTVDDDDEDAVARATTEWIIASRFGGEYFGFEEDGDVTNTTNTDASPSEVARRLRKKKQKLLPFGQKQVSKRGRPSYQSRDPRQGGRPPGHEGDQGQCGGPQQHQQDQCGGPMPERRLKEGPPPRSYAYPREASRKGMDPNRHRQPPPQEGERFPRGQADADNGYARLRRQPPPHEGDQRRPYPPQRWPRPNPDGEGPAHPQEGGRRLPQQRHFPGGMDPLSGLRPNERRHPREHFPGQEGGHQPQHQRQQQRGGGDHIRGNNIRINGKEQQQGQQPLNPDRQRRPAPNQHERDAD